MSITRTAPFGTVTDDSGGGTDGTIANNAWLTGLLNLLDARWSRTTTTSTGTQTAINPSEADLLICNNATALTIRSITAPSSPAKPGKRLVIISTGAGDVFLNHQDTTGTTAANRLVNFASSGATPLAAGVGVAVYVYDDSASRWRLVVHEQGAGITPAFAAGSYTSSGTWTVASGDVTTLRYYLTGRMLTVAFYLETTTVSGTPSSLLIGNGAWGSYTSTKKILAMGMASNAGGANEAAFLQTTASGTSIAVFQMDAGTWSNATDTTAIYGQITFEVN